eukprot:6210818-Pleurochrysis_carterae.AAC.7
MLTSGEKEVAERGAKQAVFPPREDGGGKGSQKKSREVMRGNFQVMASNVSGTKQRMPLA